MDLTYNVYLFNLWRVGSYIVVPLKILLKANLFYFSQSD